MPFIGKNPTSGFATIVKDTLTADGSTTAFTLSKQVASATDIAVFVGNVRQEPTTAYTVNGTTLDFGSGNAPATGLDMYVLHIGGTQETSIVPADGTISSAKIVSGAVTSAKLDTNIAVSGNLDVTGNLDVGTIRSANGTSALTLDSSGRVFRPVLPSWNLMGIPNAPSAGNQYIFGSGGSTTVVQGGVTHNSTTGAITVPVTGTYYVTWCIILRQSSSGLVVVDLQKSTDGGSSFADFGEFGYVFNIDTVANDFKPYSRSMILELNANEQIRLKNASGTHEVPNNDNDCGNFSGYLIG